MSEKATAERSWTLPIIPKAHNSLNWSHWGNKHRERERWAKAVLALPVGPWRVDPYRGRQQPAPGQKVCIRLVVYRKATQDPTNARASVKYLEDALVARGWAVDDTAEWLELHVEERIDRKNTRTEITWKELGQ